MKTFSNSLLEVSGASVPIDADGKTYYKWCFENPFPEKEILNITFEPANDFCGKVLVRKIEY